MADGARRRRRDALVAAPLVLALVLRVLAVLWTRPYHPLTDAAHFDLMARSLVAGDGFGDTIIAPATGPTAFRAPLYPLALAALYELGAGFTAARLAQCVLGVATVALTGAIGRELWGRRVAIVAMFVAAAYPPLVIVSTSLQWENVGLPLLLAALWLALRWRAAYTPRRLVAVGALLGLALLCRETAVVYEAGIVAVVVADCRRVAGLRAALGAAGMVVVVSVLVVLPWTARNASAFGAFVPISTSSGFAIAGTYNATAAADTLGPAAWVNPGWDPAVQARLGRLAHPDEADVDSALRRSAIEYAADHPGYVPRVLWWNTVRLFDLEGTGDALWIASFIPYDPSLVRLAVLGFYAVAALAAVGAGLGALRRVPAGVVAIVPLLWLATAAVSGSFRYRQPVEPLFVLLAAFGLVEAATLLARVRVGAARAGG